MRARAVPSRPSDANTTTRPDVERRLAIACEARIAGRQGVDQLARAQQFAGHDRAVLAPAHGKPAKMPRPSGQRRRPGRKIVRQPEIERPQMKRQGHEVELTKPGTRPKDGARSEIGLRGHQDSG